MRNCAVASATSAAPALPVLVLIILLPVDPTAHERRAAGSIGVRREPTDGYSLTATTSTMTGRVSR